MFLNIIVLFNPQYDEKELKKSNRGYTYKKISLINQFLLLYYSLKHTIKKN